MATISGMQKRMQAEVQRGGRAVRGGTNEATVGLKMSLRSQVVAAGLGSRLANSWRSKTKPEGPSMDADGMVWTKAPHIVTGFGEGSVIRPRGVTYLAIPLAAAGKGRGGARITPKAWETRTGQGLRVVKTGGRLYLVTDAATGGFTQRGAARISKRGRGKATVFVFQLVRQVKLPKRIDVPSAVRQATAALPRAIEKRWRSEERAA